MSRGTSILRSNDRMTVAVAGSRRRARRTAPVGWCFGGDEGD